jgi:chromosomal replication initiator protein
MPEPEADSPSLRAQTREAALRESSSLGNEVGDAQSFVPRSVNDLEHAGAESKGPEPGASAQRALAPDWESPNAQQLTEVWRELRTSIRKRIQPEQYETWFRRADLERVDADSICIAVQNGFSRDWLRTYYREVIEDSAQRVLARRVRAEFSVNPELTIASTTHDAADYPEGDGGSADRSTREEHGDRRDLSSTGRVEREGDLDPREASQRRRSQLSKGKGTVSGLALGSDIGLNPRYTFDNFVVGPCNRFCHAVSLGTAEAPGKTYNPLFLHGNVGLGKTHLLQAICYSLIENWVDVRILFLSCETFVNHFISALENGDLQKFRGKYRNVDVLVVDDIHLLANKERTQEEFFHTFNSLYNAGKQIILSSDSSPKEIPTLQDRLVSRFKWGLVTEIERPCYETRMAILKRKGRERGQELPEEVAQIIAERVDTNIRELEGTVNKLYSFSSVTGQAITLDFAREVLTDIFTKRRGQPSMDDIIEVVTSHFSVKLSELQSKKRTNQIAFPRQIAMFLARKITRHSLEEIGGFFGGRDHSTVLHAVRKIDNLTEDDPPTRDLLAGFLDDLHVPGQ